MSVKRRFAGLSGADLNVFHANNENRVLAFHRWVIDRGEDVVVVSLSETTYYGYHLGFPTEGRWQEVFNSNVYDNWVNPWVAGNGGGVYANALGQHGLPAAATIVIPANSIVVFARN